MRGPDQHMRDPDQWVADAAQQVVAKRAGPSANAALLAAAARRTYEDFARVAAPLIGQEGVEALMSRAVHLARRQYSLLRADGDNSAPDQGTFHNVARCLEQAEAGTAVHAAGAVFGRVAGLLATLIGERLTASLLYKAWPDDFPMLVQRSEHE